MLRPLLEDKKGQSGGLVTTLIFGVVGLVIGVIIAFIITSTLNNSNLLASGSAEQNATNRLIGNFTSGIDQVSGKLPTVLLVSAIVLILGVLAVLVGIWHKMRLSGGGAL